VKKKEAFLNATFVDVMVRWSTRSSDVIPPRNIKLVTIVNLVRWLFLLSVALAMETIWFRKVKVRVRHNEDWSRLLIKTGVVEVKESERTPAWRRQSIVHGVRVQKIRKSSNCGTVQSSRSVLIVQMIVVLIGSNKAARRRRRMRTVVNLQVMTGVVTRSRIVAKIADAVGTTGVDEDVRVIVRLVAIAQDPEVVIVLLLVREVG